MSRLYQLFQLQRYPTDRAYFIAKEILMTERTYKKDLEILNLVSITYKYSVLKQNTYDYTVQCVQAGSLQFEFSRTLTNQFWTEICEFQTFLKQGKNSK